MLNEAPKKEKKKKDYSNPNAWQLFWRIQKECLRRAVTPFLMMLFMSLLLLTCQAIVPDSNSIIEIVLGLACIVGGAFFDGHLCYHYGKMHYGAFLAGELHRKNKAYGVVSGGDHRPEREYRVWKGFLIGFYVALPAIILGIISGSLVYGEAWAYVQYAFAMFVGWAIIPITWFGPGEGGIGLAVSMYWSLLIALLPIIVSGVMYIVGAYTERRDRLMEAERAKVIAEAGQQASGNNKGKSNRK